MHRDRACGFRGSPTPPICTMPASSDDGLYDEASDDEETSDDEQPLELNDDDSDDGSSTTSRRPRRLRGCRIPGGPRARVRVARGPGRRLQLQAALADLDDSTPPPTITASMRDYQLTGLLGGGAHRCGLSGILGDEMGLGKSLQAIAMLAHLKAADDAMVPSRRRAALDARGMGAAIRRLCAERPRRHVRAPPPRRRRARASTTAASTCCSARTRRCSPTRRSCASATAGATPSSTRRTG